MTFEEQRSNLTSFSDSLLVKYPNLFPIDKDGNVCHPDCGTWCPPGWQTLVDDLCNYIDKHCKTHVSYEQKHPRWTKFNLWLFKQTFCRVYNLLWRLNDPYTKYLGDVKENSFRMIPQSVTERVKRDHPIRLSNQNILQRIQSILRPKYKHNKVPAPQVTIGQIKEKFGTLRFYYDGGDEYVRGAVSFAEYLSSKICQETGDRASLCSRGSWVKTLSPTEAATQGYTPYE